MDKRYQVFVSSTYADLSDERQEVMQALLELDCMPAGMELFPAANDDQWTLIQRVIDDCDYYLVIIAGRYGSIGPKGISYTQMEYEYAVTQGKPVIAFLHKDPGILAANRTEKEPGSIAKLDAFKELAKQKMCKFWTSPADLGSVVSRSLIKLIKTTPAIGWVRADLVPDASATEELLRLRNRIEELEGELAASQRTPVSGTESLAQGEDSFEIHFNYAAYNNKERSWQPAYRGSNSFLASWNEIFALVSPYLIDEASETTLKGALDTFAANSNAGVLAEDPDYVDHTLKDFTITTDDFNTIKVQLIALGLIGKSTKRRTRSVKDRGTYWTLTPYGENQMTSLRAIRRIPAI